MLKRRGSVTVNGDYWPQAEVLLLFDSGEWNPGGSPRLVYGVFNVRTRERVSMTALLIPNYSIQEVTLNRILQVFFMVCDNGKQCIARCPTEIKGTRHYHYRINKIDMSR